MKKKTDITMLSVAEHVKAACIQAATEGYTNAAVSGLCHEGASEASISAIRMVNVEELLQKMIDSTENSDKH